MILSAIRLNLLARGLIEKQRPGSLAGLMPGPEQRLFRVMTRAFGRSLDAALKTTLIEDLIAGGTIATGIPEAPLAFNPAALDSFMSALGGQVGAGTARRISKQLREIVNNLYIQSNSLVNRSLRRAAEITDLDRGAMQTMEGQNAFWVEQSFDTAFKPTTLKALDDGLTAVGVGPELPGQLRANLADKLPKHGEAYYQMLSSDIVARSVNMSAIRTMDEAGIKEYEIVAVLDGRTTPMCRYMDGRVIQVPSAVREVEAMMEVGVPTTPEDSRKLRNASSWIGFDKTRAAARKDALFTRLGERRSFLRNSAFRMTEVMPGVSAFAPTRPRVKDRKLNEDLAADHHLALPPYHAYCRTVVVAR